MKNKKKWVFHKNGKKKNAVFVELNGSEPDLDTDKWNKKNIVKTHNCYAYVLNIIDLNFKSKPQPGYASGYSYLTDSELRDCDKLFKRLKADNPTIIKSKYKEKCPKGFAKGYFALDIGDDTDYHFYRKDSNGYWSHKPGTTPVRKHDYSGKLITAPHKADRRSDSHNYTKSCGYFCFDKKEAKISNKTIK